MRTVEKKPHTAVVASVEEDGLRLRFPGSEEVSIKRYKYNKSVTFAAGDRVFVLPSGSSYVVAFKI